MLLWRFVRKRLARLLVPAVIAGLAAYLYLRQPQPGLQSVRQLGAMAADPQAVVRLYSAPIPYLGGMATHSWFVVKAVDSHVFDRWEVWQTAGPEGHVRRNLLSLEEDVGGGRVRVLGELTGPDAERVVAVIEHSAQQYPCRSRYFVLGPNSNTYAAWVLKRSGWHLPLPATAIGKAAAAALSGGNSCE